MVNILHNALFFIIDTLYSIYMFGFLQFLADISIMSAHVFVFTSVAVEFHTTIRNIRYCRTLNAKVNTHDITFGIRCRFNCFVYDLSNYLIILINNTHGSQFTVCKDRSLLVSHLGFNRKPFGFTVYHDRKFNMITIDFEILVVDITTRSFKHRQCSCYCDVFTLLGKLGVFTFSVTTSLVIFFNNRLCITDTLIF